jgi:hypothetical protein
MKKGDTPVRAFMNVLDELESEVKPGLGRRSFVWNYVRVVVLSRTPAEDQLWKPLVEKLEPAFRKRLRRLDCDLPRQFRLVVELSREIAEPYRIDKDWKDAPGGQVLGELRHGAVRLKLTGQTVSFGRADIPGGLKLDDHTVSREHGRTAYEGDSYWFVHCSPTSRTRVLRQGRYRDVLMHAPLRLQSGDQIFCGKSTMPILYVGPEEHVGKS